LLVLDEALTSQQTGLEDYKEKEGEFVISFIPEDAVTSQFVESGERRLQGEEILQIILEDAIQGEMREEREFQSDEMVGFNLGNALTIIQTEEEDRREQESEIVV
jgi:hypothetical protein